MNDRPVAVIFVQLLPARSTNKHLWNPVVDDDRESEYRDRVRMSAQGLATRSAMEATDGRG